MVSIRPRLEDLKFILANYPLRFRFKTKDPNTSYYVFKLDKSIAIIPERYVIPFLDDKVQVGKYEAGYFTIYVMRPKLHETVYYIDLNPDTDVVVFDSEDLNEAVLMMLVDKYVV